MSCDLIFWNVDTQYDFISDGSNGNYVGKLPVPGAMDILNNLNKITSLAGTNNKRVVNTRDWHTLDSEEISESPDGI